MQVVKYEGLPTVTRTSANVAWSFKSRDNNKRQSSLYIWMVGWLNKTFVTGLLEILATSTKWWSILDVVMFGVQLILYVEVDR